MGLICGFTRDGIDHNKAVQTINSMLECLIRDKDEHTNSFIISNFVLGWTGTLPLIKNNSKYLIADAELYNQNQEGLSALLEFDTEKSLAKLNGLFCIAIIDEKVKKLTLIRDRVGFKSLYYYKDGKNIYFASRLQALLTLPGISKQVDMEALDRYLTSGYVTGGEKTIVKNFYKLRSAHMLIFDNGIKTLKRYWYPADEKPVQYKGNLYEEFLEKLKDAVAIQVPVDGQLVI